MLLVQDLKYAFASMRRNPGFALAALVTLALGIGATTAVFSVVYGVLLRPLPYPAADRLVRLSEEHPGGSSPLRQPMLSTLTYYSWTEHPRTLDAIAAYTWTEYTITYAGASERMVAATVTPSLFGLLGAAPALGRFFSPDEGPEGANAVIVLSDRAWRERFSGDPAIVGRGLLVDGKPYTIVGVARPGFYFPDRDTLAWTPMEPRKPDPAAVAGGRGSMGVINVLARLAPKTTAAQAEAEGTSAARALPRPMAANLLFGEGGPVVVHVRGVVDEMTRTIRPTLVVLAGAVVMVLLIACANVANLFLSRGVARQRELSVRAAIGASRARLAGQLFTESAALAAAGGAAGLLIAWASVRLAPVAAPRDFPRLADIRIDARVLVCAIAAAAVAALVSGLAPALRGARFDLASSLHGGDGATAGGFRGLRARRLRDTLLVAEAAFAVMLLVGAALLARSFVRLTHVDAGYTARGVLTMAAYLPGDRDAQKGRVKQLVEDALDRLRAMPGVRSAGAGNMVPLDNATMIAGFPVPGQMGAAHPKLARAIQYIVTPGYAEALGLRLRAGRLFVESDLTRGVRPWIVNEEFARLYLPASPAGFQFPWRSGDDNYFNAEIIGVVGNVLKNGNDAKPQPEVYQLPRDRAAFDTRFEMAIRSEGDPSALAPAVRQLLHELAPEAAVETVPLASRVAESVDQPRFAMTVLLAFATLALVLAAVGLYGTLSYAISQRRRELGVRAALGATRGELVRLVAAEGLLLAGLGSAIGLAGAAILTRLMQGALFGVAPLDAASFAAAPAVLLPIAFVSSLIPALRAARIDPAHALRTD